MEAYFSATARAEAQRWIGIAEKLLAARDLVGSKSFALRSQESDPTSEPAAQILAVVDTLFAGEKRINNQHDLYAILQLPPSTHDWEIIAANYRRLALLLNPHMNNFPFADQAFRFVLEAWSVLSNPSRKSVYDNEINFQPTFNPVVPGRVREPEEQQLPPNLHQNQHPLQEQEQQQPQFQVRQSQNQSPRKSAENVREEESELNHSDDSNDDESSTFWTACPYCYNMYEYPRVYVECTLRCQNCRRAFQAVKVPSPQLDFDQKGAVFSCWGFFPLGIPNSEKNNGGGSNWCPFSQIVACPQVVNNAKVGARRKSTVRRSSGPVVYIDDDQDVFDEMSDPGDDDSSDGDWRTSSYKRKKKAKRAKGKVSSGRRGRPAKLSGGGNAKNVNGGVSENVRGGFVVQKGAGVPNVPSVERLEPSRKVVGNNSRRQTGRIAKNLGKLDLNVEFSNEVEDPAQSNGGGRREEDNIEGIGFFEGLDEFLSNLPILSVVGEDKVKAG